MYVSGVKTADRGILLPLLDKSHAKAVPLPKERYPFLLEQMEGEKERRNILMAARATEMHMALSCIAMGILQSISVCSLGKVSSVHLRYQGTPSRGRVSEATLMAHLRKYFFMFMERQPELRITQIIREKQATSRTYGDSLAS